MGVASKYRKSNLFKMKDSMTKAEMEKKLKEHDKILSDVEYNVANEIVTNAPMINSGDVRVLNDPGTGDGSTGRTGDKFQCKSLEVSGFVDYDLLSTNNQHLARVLLVIDHNNNNVAATAGDILTGVNVYAPRNLANRSRFKILKDWKFVIHSGASGQGAHFFKYFKNIDVRTQFTNNNSGVSNMTKGVLLLVFLSDQTSNQSRITFHARTRYTDL